MRNAVLTALAAFAAVVEPALAQTPAAPLRLSFADAVAQAAGAAPAVTLAALRTDEAAARARQARGSLLPSLTGSAGFLNRSFNRASLGFTLPTVSGQPPPPDLIGPFDNVDARLRVTQTLFDYASLARVRAARAQVTGSRAEEGVAVEGAAQGAALAYLRAARAAALVEARQADSGLAAELVALAREQREAGVSAAIDVTRARTQLVAAEGALIIARNRLDRARIEVLRSLGLDPATALELGDTLSTTLAAGAVPARRDSTVALALAGRPELQAEIARGSAARRAQSAIAAERFPRLELAADYGANGPTVGDAIATRQIGLQVTIPLLDGFRREGRLAEQQAVVRQTEIRERELRQQIAAEVDAALLDLGSALAQQAVATEALQLAEEELSQARERFAAGVAGNIEVINAQVSLLRARDTDIDALYAAAAARVALARAVGSARTLH